MEKGLFLKSRMLYPRIENYWSICFLSLLVTFIINSCTKDQPQSNVDRQIVNDITFQDGRLIFKDLTTFKEYQKWIFYNQANPQLIAERNNSLGLKSMTEYYLEGIKLAEDDPLFLAYITKYPNIFNKVAYDNSTLYFLPHSKILCYIANKDGIFQIGDKINRIVWNYIYEISSSDNSNIELLFLPKEIISDYGVKVTQSQSIGAKNDYGNRTRYFSNSKYRIVSSLRENVYLDIWYNEIQTNPQKKTLGVWLGAQLNTKSANGSGYYNVLGCSGCQQQTLYSSYVEETGLSHHTIYWGDWQLNMDDSYCPAYSRGRLDSEYIYVSWTDALDSTPSYTEPNWTPGVDEPY